MNYYIFIPIAFILGFLTCFIPYKIRIKRAGTLRIDTTNPEKDLYSFEFTKIPISELPKQKKVILIIDPNAILSQNSSQ